MTERIIDKNELMILFNELFTIGKKSFSVRYPFYNISLFDFSLDFRITNVIEKERFQEIRAKHMPDDDFLKADQPSYGDLESTFLSCGAVDYSNWKDVLKWMTDLILSSKDPRRMAGSLIFSIDTNILYNRFLTGYLPTKDLDFPLEDIEIVISNLVRREISNRIRYKYRHENLVKMRKVYKNPRYLDEFANRNTLLTRRAKLAQHELDMFTNELSAHSVEMDAISHNSEEVDIQIVKSYQAFGQRCGVNVALLTTDQNMADHAKNYGLMYHVLSHPRGQFRCGEVNPWSSLLMFHDLAVKFGVLALGGTGILLFGEWRGKTSQDYTRSRLKLSVVESSAVHDDLMRDLELCEKMVGDP